MWEKPKASRRGCLCRSGKNLALDFKFPITHVPYVFPGACTGQLTSVYPSPDPPGILESSLEAGVESCFWKT